MLFHIFHNGMVFLLCELFYVFSDMKTWSMLYHISHNGMVFLQCELFYVVAVL